VLARHLEDGLIVAGGDVAAVDFESNYTSCQATHLPVPQTPPHTRDGNIEEYSAAD
jgi:hypothetical protein